ncbi:hypothetical protein [Sphingomonas sp. UYP23]
MRATRIPLMALATLGGLLAVPVSAQSTGLEDMVGARAGQAENGIRARGYELIRADRGDDRSYTYWWSTARRQCVTIATMDGRYASVTPTLPPDCGKTASATAYPARPAYPPPYRPSDDRRGDSYGGAPSVDGRQVTLGLVCFGDGSRDGLATGTQWQWNAQRDRYEYGSYTESRREMFDASLMIQLWDGGGRIRLPKSLIPPINSRGDSGWWDLYDVQPGRDMITASYRLNGLNKPRVTIDRRAGRISVQGLSSYGFRGTCDQLGGPNRF